MKLIEANLPPIDGPLVLGCLASGNASSFRRVVKAIEQGQLDATTAILISNKPDAPALDFARSHGIRAVLISKDTEGSTAVRDEKILQELVDAGVNLFILSGYLPLVTDVIIAQLPSINIHPSLLPKFGGKGMHGIHVHQAVLEAEETVSGATTHLVDNQLDHGLILAQETVPVFLDDTPETLGARVQAIEPPLMVATLQAVSRRRQGI